MKRTVRLSAILFFIIALCLGCASPTNNESSSGTAGGTAASTANTATEAEALSDPAEATDTEPNTEPEADTEETTDDTFHSSAIPADTDSPDETLSVQESAAVALLEYLDCTISYSGPGDDAEGATRAYYIALEKGKREGFTPVIIAPDNVLAEAIAYAVCEGGELTAEAGRTYREKLFEATLPDAREILDSRRKKYAYIYLWHLLDSKKPAELEHEEPVFGAGTFGELVVVNVPTDKPWRIFAWLPFGGFNDCPSNGELTALAEYWFHAYGAYPAYISYDRLEFNVENPVPAEEAMDVAKDHIAVCPTIAEYVAPSYYAGTINGDGMWTFWWD